MPAKVSAETMQGRRRNVDLKSMSDIEILESVRAMEATYKQSFATIDEDHRIHLTREQLENVYGLVSRTLELRRIDPGSMSRPHSIRNIG